jgi:hypothetical protein
MSNQLNRLSQPISKQNTRKLVVRRKKRRPKASLYDVDTKAVHGSYLAWSPKKKKDYVGYSKQPWQRFRQHRGEIQGGADRTREFKDKDIRPLYVVGPFMNQRDGLQFEAAVQTQVQGPTARCLFVANTLGDPHAVWTSDSKIPAGDPQRTHAVGPFHVFWFRNLPLTEKKRFELDAAIAKGRKTNGVIHHMDATMEQVQAFWKQQLASLKDPKNTVQVENTTVDQSSLQFYFSSSSSPSFSSSSSSSNGQ